MANHIHHRLRLQNIHNTYIIFLINVNIYCQKLLLKRISIYFKFGPLSAILCSTPPKRETSTLWLKKWHVTFSTDYWAQQLNPSEKRHEAGRAASRKITARHAPRSSSKKC